MKNNIVVYEEPLMRQYKASRFSSSYVFLLLFNLLILLVPFILYSGSAGGLWVTTSSYYEQPDVKFLYKFMMVLEATSPATGQTKEIFVSNLDSLNVLRPGSYRSAIISVNDEDQDLDEKVDSFTLEADVPIGEDEQIQSMQAMLFFNYKLDDRVKFDMESIAYTSVDSSNLISFDTSGTLVLRQSNPLGIRDSSSTLYEEETPLLDNNGLTSIDDILKTYRDRKVAVDYEERYPIKTRATKGEASAFHFKMKINIPNQEILCIPTLVEVLKDGWIKYLSFAVLCWMLVDKIKRFSFTNYLLPSRVHTSLTKRYRHKE